MQWNKFIRHLSVDLCRHIIPLFRRYGDRPRLFGSGTLATDGHSFFIITAAHVIDGAFEGKEVFYYVEPGLTQTIGCDCVTTLDKIGGSRDDDHYDIGVFRIEGPRFPPYPEVNAYPIRMSALRPYALPRDNKEYLLVGFPASRAKQRGIDKVIGLRPFSFRNGSLPLEKYHALGFNPEVHILLGFDQKRVIDEKGSIYSAPAPHGMSGSPLWLIYSENEKLDPLFPSIVGIVTEHYKSNGFILATDIAVALNIISDLK